MNGQPIRGDVASKCLEEYLSLEADCHGAGLGLAATILYHQRLIFFRLPVPHS